jgi:hypothetical protein
MLTYPEPLDWLPMAEDLPDSDDTPVDNDATSPPKNNSI